MFSTEEQAGETLVGHVKKRGSDTRGQPKKMLLVSGMIPGDSRSAFGIEKALDIDKIDVFVNPEDDTGESACGLLACFDGVGL